MFIAVRSFADVVNRITVTKRPGMENVPLLVDSGKEGSYEEEEEEEEDEEDSLFSALAAMFGGEATGRKKADKGDAQAALEAPAAAAASAAAGASASASATGAGEGGATADKPLAPAGNDEDGKIHVFSLATGHLYERLLRIMMLSVTKRTSMPVKFWLFENYLSPSFKTIAAAMAQVGGGG